MGKQVYFLERLMSDAGQCYDAQLCIIETKDFNSAWRLEIRKLIVQESQDVRPSTYTQKADFRKKTRRMECR